MQMHCYIHLSNDLRKTPLDSGGWEVKNDEPEVVIWATFNLDEVERGIPVVFGGPFDFFISPAGDFFFQLF
jgi:hypothetical protein